MSAMKKAVVKKKPVKKTAVKSVAKKSPKKVAIKKPAAKKPVVKKADKAVVKKVVKKTTKKVTAKKVVKTTPKVTASKKVTKAKSVTKSVLPKDTVTIPDVSKMEHIKNAKSTVALASFMVPADMDRFAITIARTAGVFFVFLGMVFTVVLSNQINSSENSYSFSNSSFLNFENQSASLYTATKANVSFDLPTNEELVNNVPIIIGVDDAKIVRVFAQFNNSGQLLQLGNAVQKSAKTWELMLDTNTLPNGHYSFVAIIENNKGENIFNKDIKTVVVNNSSNLAIQSISDSAETDEDMSTSTVQDITPPKALSKTYSAFDTTNTVLMSFVADTDPLTNFVPVTITAPDNGSVELYARFGQLNDEIYIGKAFLVKDLSWEYLLNTKELPDGDYKLFVKYANANTQINTSDINVSIYNNNIKPVLTEFFEEIAVTDISQINHSEFVVTDQIIAASTVIDSSDLPTEVSISKSEKQNLMIIVDGLLLDSKVKIDNTLTKLADAIRASDEGQTNAIKENLFQIQEELVNKDISALGGYEEELGNLLRTIIIQDILSVENYIKNTDVKTKTPVDTATPDNVQTPTIVQLFPIKLDNTIFANQVSESVFVSGKTIPNAFVSLKINKKTSKLTKSDNNGNWATLFDKTLDRKDNNVTVSAIDNYGKDIAESAPLTFHKEGDLFESVSTQSSNNSASIINSGIDTDMTARMYYLIASLAVVSLGLLLILIGLYLRSKTTIAENS